MVLLICVLWVGYDFHAAQSASLENETIWVTFLHVVWYDRAAAGMCPHRGQWRNSLCLLAVHIHMHISPWSQRREEGSLGFLALKQTVCELSCHLPLLLLVSPVHINHIYTLNVGTMELEE